MHSGVGIGAAGPFWDGGGATPSGRAGAGCRTARGRPRPGGPARTVARGGCPARSRGAPRALACTAGSRLPGLSGRPLLSRLPAVSSLSGLPRLSRGLPRSGGRDRVWRSLAVCRPVSRSMAWSGPLSRPGGRPWSLSRSGCWSGTVSWPGRRSGTGCASWPWSQAVMPPE